MLSSGILRYREDDLDEENPHIHERKETDHFNDQSLRINRPG